MQSCNFGSIDTGTGSPQSVVQKECLDLVSFLKTDGLAITVSLMRLTPAAKSGF